MNKTTLKVMTVCVLALPASSFAASQKASAPEAAAMGPQAAGAVGAQLSALYGKLALKTVEAQIARKDAEIADANKPRGTLGAGHASMPRGAVQGAPQGGRSDRSRPEGHAVSVQLISGSPGKLTAQLRIGDDEVFVQPGDVIQGNWRVVRITAAGVDLQRGRATKHLGV